MNINCSPKHNRIIATVLIVLFFVLCIRGIVTISPNHDEAANVTAGISIWKYGRFDLYPVNPPLVKFAASFIRWLRRSIAYTTGYFSSHR